MVNSNYVAIAVITPAMREKLLYFKWSSFLFGTRPTLLLATFGLVALSLPAVFTIFPAGAIESTIRPRHTIWALGSTAFLLIMVGIIVWANCRSTYSPFLHQKISVILITTIYVAIVVIVTSVGGLLYFRFVQRPVPTTTPELAIWSTIVAFYALIAVVHITVRNFQPPSNRLELEGLVSKLSENRSSAEINSNYTGFLDSIEENLEDISDTLNEATTPGGKKLAREVEGLSEEYRSIPSDVQIVVVDSSRSPADKDLTDLKIQFETITERLSRIS